MATDSTDAPETAKPGPLARLDRFMADSPWHAYVVPFFVWIACLFVLSLFTDRYPWLYPAVYILQIVAVMGLLIRYRRLTPELNIKFHWLAIPTGVGLLYAWLYLGWFTTWLIGLMEPSPDVDGMFAGLATWIVSWFKPKVDAEGALVLSWFERVRAEQGVAFFWLCMSLKFVGMVIVVPLFEELFTRALLLRAFHDRRKTLLGLTQVASDFAVIGDRIASSDYGKRALAAGPVLTEQLKRTPVGAISVFAITLSTLIFMLNHHPRDYLGCVACGVVWCLLLWWTNRGLVKAWAEGELPEGDVSPAASPRKPALGLGPIVWSHAITNALLWGWTVWRDYASAAGPDWRFL